MVIKNKKYFFAIVAIVFFSLCVLFACSAEETSKSDTIIVTISVKDEVYVNGDQVSPDSLLVKLKELGASAHQNIRIVPDPEAGMGIIDKVQRNVSLYKSNIADSLK